jgi:hypothetical protein
MPVAAASARGTTSGRRSGAGAGDQVTVTDSHHPALRMAPAASSRRQCPRDSWTCCQRPWLSRGREWPEGSRIGPLCAGHLAVATLGRLGFRSRPDRAHGVGAVRVAGGILAAHATVLCHRTLATDWALTCGGSVSVAKNLCVTDARLPGNLSHFATSRPVPGRCHLAGGLGEALAGVQGEFKRRQRAGRFDEVAGVAGQAGRHVADHRRAGRAGGWQVKQPVPRQQLLRPVFRCRGSSR